MIGFFKSIPITTYITAAALITLGGYHIYSKGQSYSAGYNAAVIEYKKGSTEYDKEILKKLEETYAANIKSERNKRAQVEKDIARLEQALEKIRVDEKNEILKNTQCKFIDSDLARLRNSFFGDKPLLDE